MKNFPKDCAFFLNCGATADCLSLLLCESLAGTAYNTGELGLAAKASSLAGMVACQPDMTIPFDTPIEMHHAVYHYILRVDEDEEMLPAPVLIIDEFYCDTKANEDFIRTLLRDASSAEHSEFLG
jgi:hypothetical protein